MIYAQLIMGALSGWITTPSLWIFFRPLAWVAYILATAKAESNFVADASGDGGASLGALQYNDGDALVMLLRGLGQQQDPDWRLSPFWAAHYAADRLAGVILSDWRWWGIGLPVIGTALARVAWRFGSWPQPSVDLAGGLVAFLREQVSDQDGTGAPVSPGYLRTYYLARSPGLVVMALAWPAVMAAILAVPGLGAVAAMVLGRKGRKGRRK